MLIRKPVAAIAGSSNHEDVSMSSAPAPVAVVMGMMSNPAGYTALNFMSVIEGDSFSDESMSTPCPKGTASLIPPTVLASSVLMAPCEELALLTVPHLY